MTFQEVHRRALPYDVVAVAGDAVIEGRHLGSVRLTVVLVSDDGSVDASETTGGHLFHLAESEFRLVSPPRGLW